MHSRFTSLKAAHFVAIATLLAACGKQAEDEASTPFIEREVPKETVMVEEEKKPQHEIIHKWENTDVAKMLERQDLSDLDKFFLKDIAEKCPGQTVKGVTNVPMRHDLPNTEVFTYFFEHEVKDASKPTIIYLPGGPGGTAITKREPLHGFSYINIDPRGTGCNFHPRSVFSHGHLTTWQTVRDIITVIKTLELKDYVLFGHSYGTVMATILADELQKDTATTQPRAIVLEGTLGKKIDGHFDYYNGFLKQWQRFWLENPELHELFTGEQLPLGKSRAAWGTYVSNVGNEYGELRKKLLKLKDELKEYKSSDAMGSVMEELSQAVDEPSSTIEPMANELDLVLESVLCQELSDSWFTNIDIVRWELTASGEIVAEYDPERLTNLCEGIPLNSPYDSRNHQIKVPLYYLQGEVDPQTTVASARYHYTGQKQSPKKQFIATKEGGHGLTLIGGPLEKCAQDLWLRIFDLQPLDDFLTADGLCPTPPTPESFGLKTIY